MVERAEERLAATTRDERHAGVIGHTEEEDHLPTDHEGIGDETDQAPSRGGDRGSWMPIVIWLAVVVAVAIFIVYAGG